MFPQGISLRPHPWARLCRPVSPAEAAASWTLTIHPRAGQDIVIEGVATFVFNDAGQIRSVRDYWELDDQLSQL